VQQPINKTNIKLKFKKKRKLKNDYLQKLLKNDITAQ